MARQEAGEHGENERVEGSETSLKEMKIKAELYGGLGDSTLGLSLDPAVT
jgi:hypothetical protein